MQQSSGSMGHSKHRKCKFHKITARSPHIQLEMMETVNRMNQKPKRYQEWFSSVAEAFKSVGKFNK